MTALGFFWRAVGHHPLKTFLLFLTELLQAALVIALPFVIRDLVNAVVAYDPAVHPDFWRHVHEPLWFFFGLTILLGVISRVAGLVLAFFAPVLRIKPRAEMVNHLQNHPIDFFQSRHSGALGNKVNETCTGLGFAIWTLAFDVWPVVIKFFVSAALLIMTDMTMAAIMAIWAVFYFGVIFMVAITQSKSIEKISNARANITGLVVDMATNIQVMKSYGNEKLEQDNLNTAMNHEKEKIIRFQVIRELAGWYHTIMSTGIMLVMIWLALDAYAAGTISVGDIAFVFTIILLVTEQARSLTWALTHFLEYVGQIRDGVKTVMRKHILTDRNDAGELEITQAEIHYDRVQFSYPDAIVRPVLKDFELYIPAGQKIGIVGASGAGKSTLMNLLLRFYDVQGGAIKIDRQDIKVVTQRSLRQAIAVIPQDTSLFHRSLMDNIRYGRLDATDAEVAAAAKRAHAHDFIIELEQGYETLVGERGVRLSGGQRQRIAIARAILKDAPILVLDEATSALDSESEKLIQDSLKDLMQGKTVLAIAHRLSTIAHLDRLIVMQDGCIIEDGKHDDLLSQNGLYAKLWSMQSGGFLKEIKE